MEQLVEDTRHGDANAQAKLYKQCYKKAVNTCQRIVGDPLLSEEIADDAFLVAFSKLHQLEDGHRFEPWLSQIVRRLALRHLQRSHNLPTVPLEEVADIPEDDAPLLSEEEILRAIENLPQGYRDVFRMSVLDGKSHIEIAAQLVINPHSSSSQLTRAKRMLRNTLRFGWFILIIPIVWFVLHHQHDKPALVAKTGEKPNPSPVEERCTEVPPTFIRSTIIASSPNETNTITEDTPICINLDTLVPEPTIILRQWDQSDQHITASSLSRWSFSVSHTMPTVSTSSQTFPYSLSLANGNAVDNWLDYVTATTNPDGASIIDSVISNIAVANIENNGGQILRTSHNHAPVAFSLSASYKLTHHWSIGTGIGLTLLQSDFTIGERSNSIKQTQRLVYLDLPIGMQYHFFPSHQLSFYAALSASFHLPLSGTLTTDYIINGEKTLTEHNRIDNVPMISFGIGIGLQWHITPSIGIYAEPSLRYYCIPTGAPASFLSQNPLSLSLPCGLRFIF
ncbi:MAG: sigma-70 family RNA polymerase sigma factor [Bacteroidales bacterium]|nr:sigma-70 family RNA polymerase sigma factor [Bacteroidales bacterium]